MNLGFALGVCVGLLGGALGAYAFQRHDVASVPEDATPPPRTRLAPEGASTPRLEGSPPATNPLAGELARAQARIAVLEAEREASRREATPPTPAPPPPADPDALPKSAREQARSLGISDAALESLWEARGQYHAVDAARRESLLAPLRPLGDAALEAVAVLNRAGGGHISIPMIVRDLGLPGGAELLIHRIEEEPRHLGSLLTALPGYDSPRVRAYLVERIARETDPAAYWHVATALGELHEAAGAEAMHVRQFTGPMFGGVRGYILQSIAQMGGAHALRLLEDYLLLPHADSVGSALNALATLDGDRARSHATRIKEGERFAFLAPQDRSEVLRLTR